MEEKENTSIMEERKSWKEEQKDQIPNLQGYERWTSMTCKWILKNNRTSELEPQSSRCCVVEATSSLRSLAFLLGPRATWCHSHSAALSEGGTRKNPSHVICSMKETRRFSYSYPRGKTDAIKETWNQKHVFLRTRISK